VAQPRPKSVERPGRVALGVLMGAHGVRGLVRVKSFAAEPKALTAYGALEDEAGARRFALTVKGGTKDMLIAAIDGVDNRDAAERLKGEKLYVARGALPAPASDEFYHADLIGLEVRLKDGAAFGRVRAVQNFGAGDSLEIERAQGDILVPFTARAVPEVNIAAGYLTLDPPVGLLDK
jgi:16S rRNA processing protein RimM